MDSILRETIERRLFLYKEQVKKLTEQSDEIEHNIRLIQDEIFDLQYQLKGKE